MAELEIEPDGPFSLEAAAGFGFGPIAERPPFDGRLRLAFAVDGFRGHAGVSIEQAADGTIRGHVGGDGDAARVEGQVRRVLSLDGAGDEWLAVGARDPVIGKLQARHPGQRPVLFHSPYEAATWAVLSARQHRRQATALRDRLAAELGRTFALDGQQLHAFPLPDRLVDLDAFDGLAGERLRRLRAVAEAALGGRLDADRLLALGPERAEAEVRQLPGLGPFYASLVVVRGTGFHDVLPVAEPRLLSHVGHLYELGAPADQATLARLAEAWRPFRTWTVVLLRLAGDRAGLPAPAGSRRR